MRPKSKLLISSVVILSSIIGCESRFVESSPDSVKISGVPLEERLSQKAKTDTRLNEIQKGIDKAKRILDMVRRIQSPNSRQDVYTPFDFLLDVNIELKSQIPENQEDRLIRRGKLVLPIKALSKDCQKVETLLESEAVFEKSTDETPTGERLIYSLRTCGSEGQYVQAAEAVWSNGTLEFRFFNKNLETLFKGIAFTDFNQNTSCKIIEGEKDIIDKVVCDNVRLDLSDSEYALISKMAFSNSGMIRFEALADIFENNRKKAISSIQVFKDGEVKFDVTKVELPN